MNERASKRKFKQACVDCHFLTELEFSPAPDDFSVDPPLMHGFYTTYTELYSNKREQAKKNDYSEFKSLNQGPLQCYLECWKERNIRQDQKLDVVRHNIIVETDRSDCYLFFEYTPTMSFEAAVKMRDMRESLEVTKQQQEIKSVETTLLYNKTTGKFRYGNEISIAVSKNARARVRRIAEQLMECWQKGKPCRKNELVRPLISPVPQGVSLSSILCKPQILHHTGISILSPK